MITAFHMRPLLFATVTFLAFIPHWKSLCEDTPPALIEKYCIRCHGDEKVEADIDLRGPYSQINLLDNREVWLNALEQIESEEMPPKKPVPATEEYESMIAWIEETVHNVDWSKFHDPGRMSLTRLTTVEYRNAIRDIFEIDLQAGAFLGKDPEGNTGFSNDHESLTFPLFAFDNFMREAERVTDAYLSYGRNPWRQEVDLVAAWKTGSDRSVDLNSEGNAILLKERNAPYQLNLDLPFAGMYEIGFLARTEIGEPISAMRIMVNGTSIDRLVIDGEEAKSYSVIVNLPAGANVVSLGYDPDRAPIIQEIFPPRSVPESIANRILEPKVRPFPMPDRLNDKQQARKAWKKLNNTIRAFTHTQRLADHLVKTGRVDYEKHDLIINESRQIGLFSPSKVPFNLAAGSVAVFLEIPQARLERQIKEVTGFFHPEYQKSVKAFKSKWKEKYPERIRRMAGRIALERAVIRSHATGPDEEVPSDLIRAGTSSDMEARKFLHRLGTRAYGRKMEKEELDALMRIFRASLAETGSRDDGLRDAIIGLLISPPFLLRYYVPSSESPGRIGTPDIARRLARFLWLSIPDAPLRSLGERKKLAERKVLQSTIDRMIADPRFDAMTSMFVEQWLDLESLSRTEEANDLAPHKVMAMQMEPVLLFRHVFRENRSLLELIDADYTFLNDSLALHYKIDGVEGRTMRPVKLSPEDQRGGLLAMGGILTATSTPERTSPVTRGAFMVELLLGEDLPPPPPSVPELKTNNKARTVREELEAHRDDKACSGCHSRIDPYGFVLEHYDQFGAWRDTDNGNPVNAATELEDGTRVSGLVEFKKYIVARRQDDFVRNIVERMFEFAISREVRYSDEATILKILNALEKDGYRARTLVQAIVTSDAFQSQSNPIPIHTER